MMDAVSELLLSGIARTTLCTTLAALVTLLLLSALGICSTRIHRTAWVLVILQGWILIPLTFTVSIPSAIQPQQLPSTSVNHFEPLATIHSSIILQAVELSSWQRHGKQAATAAWLLGILAVLSFYMKRYYSLVTHVPLGSETESGDWNDEWREVADAILPRANVYFRITSQVGPLLCFVPFIYLILVPRLLWASLSRDDRIAIFRHELAHLKNGDLWKNLVIRILAMPQWFNPLVWLAIRRFEEAGEWACDEEVLASTNLADTRYANTLLRVAGLPANAPCGAVAACGGVLTRRVTRLLSSSDKEVSKMKNLAVPVLLLAMTAVQAVRIEPVVADEPVKPAAVETRAEAVAKWHAEPYHIEPPDVLSIELMWDGFEGKGENGAWLKAKNVQMTGDFLVGPDGAIVLNGGTQIHVAGMTVEEVKKALLVKQSGHYGAPQVNVKVAQDNSKVVYIVEKRPSGDCVTRIPCTKETNILQVLTAEMNHVDIKDKIHIMSPVGHTGRPADRLEVDLEALLTKRDLTTNYDLLPGDRIFVLTDTASTESSGPTSTTPPTEVLQGTYDAPTKPADLVAIPSDAIPPTEVQAAPEPISNSLLASVAPGMVNSLTEMVANRDAKPDRVMVNVCIAELLPPSRNANNEDGVNDDLEAENIPTMEEDGAAWLAWAKKHGRLEILSLPQVMTLDGQPAFIQVGTMVPTVASKLETGGPAKDNQLEQTFVGLNVGLTPRTTPEGFVHMELDIERAVANEDGADGPNIQKMKVQTTIAAKDGQTIVLGGLNYHVEDDIRSMVIAVTPRVNPKR
jgi:beta-lactamase regulating signal transducer with metallopeptidase domain/protein involved in polysaccharide export with SLBB domain